MGVTVTSTFKLSLLKYQGSAATIIDKARQGMPALPQNVHPKVIRRLRM